MSVETNNRYKTFDSQLLLGNTGIFGRRREDTLPLYAPLNRKLADVRPYTRMRIDGQDYNAISDFRTVRSLLNDLIPTQADIIRWGVTHPDIVHKHQSEYIGALSAQSVRQPGEKLNIAEAILAINSQNEILQEVARDNLIRIMMERHGFNPNDECDSEKFNQYLLQGTRVADELINEERDFLTPVWEKSSLPTVTELQEQVKTDNLYTLIRFATNPRATAKIREEATRKAVLIDQAIAAILRIESANGTIEEVHKVLDAHLWEEEQIGEIQLRGIVMTHDVRTERCLSWEIYDPQKHGARGSRLPKGETWVQRYYEMPFHQIIHNEEQLQILMTSRKKEDVATLAKLLLKNGELPEDIRGIRFVVDSPEHAKLLSQLLVNAFHKSGWLLMPQEKGQTLTLTGGFSIELADGTHCEFVPPDEVINQAKSSGFGVLQFDAQVEAATPTAQHTLHPMKQFEVQIFSIASLRNSQREWEIGDPKPNFHAGYVLTKRFFERRIILDQFGNPATADNYYTRLFPDWYLTRIQQRRDETDVDRASRIRTMLDSEEQPFRLMLIEGAHRRIRDESSNRYIPY